MQILISFHSVHNLTRAHPSNPLIFVPAMPHTCNDPFTSNTPNNGKEECCKVERTRVSHPPSPVHKRSAYSAAATDRAVQRISRYSRNLSRRPFGFQYYRYREPSGVSQHYGPRTVDAQLRVADNLLDGTLLLEIRERFPCQRSVDLQTVDEGSDGDEAV